MHLTEAAIRAECAQITDPNTGQDLIKANAVRAVGVDGLNAAIELQLSYPAKSEHPALIAQIAERLKSQLGAQAISIRHQHPNSGAQSPERAVTACRA